MRQPFSLNPEEEAKERDLPGGHCNIPETKALTRRQQNNNSKTNRGEPNNKLGDVDGGNVGDKLCYFWCTDAIHSRFECWTRAA